MIRKERNELFFRSRKVAAFFMTGTYIPAGMFRHGKESYISSVGRCDIVLADQGAAEFTGYHVQYGILPGAFKQYSGRHVIFPENTFLQAPESGLAAHKGKGLISEIPERNDREPGGRIIFFAAVQRIIRGDCDKYLFSA